MELLLPSRTRFYCHYTYTVRVCHTLPVFRNIPCEITLTYVCEKFLLITLMVTHLSIDAPAYSRTQTLKAPHLVSVVERRELLLVANVLGRGSRIKRPRSFERVFERVGYPLGGFSIVDDDGSPRINGLRME